MQVLVLRLDYKASTYAETLQKQLATASGSSQKTMPPHLSLQLFEKTNPALLKQTVENNQRIFRPLSLSFGSLGFFKQKGTFFAAPSVTADLIKMHAEIHLATQEFGGQSDLYKPGTWVPHLTLANHVAPPYWGPMFARLSMEFEPFKANVAAIECWTVIGDRVTTEWSLFLEG